MEASSNHLDYMNLPPPPPHIVMQSNTDSPTPLKVELDDLTLSKAVEFSAALGISLNDFAVEAIKLHLDS
jgi:hypothetical protein